MSLTKVTYSMIKGAVINVLDYGADNTGLVDSTTAIQTAINACANQTNNGAVYLPSGDYKITATLNIPYGVSIYGDGATSSVIKCYDCDGLTFTSYGYQSGSMFYEDFGLTAESGTNRAAFYTPANASTMDGLYLNRLRFYNWNQCIVWRSNWECSVENCVFYKVNQCVSLDGGTGQNVYIRIANNRMTCVGGGLGAADKWAINSLQTTSFRESLQITGNLIYGFSRAIFIEKGYVVNIIGNDIGAATEYGIYFVTAAGTYTIQSNMIASLSGTGLFAAPLNVPESTARALIVGNNFVNQNTATVGLQINSSSQTNNFNLCIRDNWFGSFTTNDILTYNPGQTIIDGNRLTSSAPTNSIVIGNVQGGTYPNRPPVTITNNYFAKSIGFTSPTDYTDGSVVYYNNIENGTFQSSKQSAAPTTGTWRITDVVMNSAPTVGQPKGWVCTVAGTPGTWVSLGNL